MLIRDPADHKTLESMLEWSPLIMVYDRALEALQANQDRCCNCPFRSGRTGKAIDRRTPSTENIGVPSSGKSAQTGFHFLIREKQIHVTVVACEAADLWDTIQHTAKGLQVTLVTGDIKWSLIISGIFDKWLPAGHEPFFIAKYPVLILAIMRLREMSYV